MSEEQPKMPGAPARLAGPGDEEAPAPGVRRFVLPTPYAVGPVNAYLVTGAEPTLVDAGPATPEAVHALVARLGEAGLAPGDVRRVIVTHAHPDHFGALALLRERVSWEVCAHPAALLWMGGDPALREERVAFYVGFLRQAGVPAGALRAMEREGLGLRQYPCGIAVHRFLGEGDAVPAGDGELVVRHTPGHSCSSICLLRADGILFSGDTLLGHISSNALVEPVESWRGARRPSLPEYLDTLARVREMPVRAVLPGHGDAICDPGRLVEERLGFYRARREMILRLLQTGPATVYRLCLSLFPGLGPDQLFLGLSETVGYLDLLEAEGLAEYTLEEGVAFYRFTGAAAGGAGNGPSQL